MAWEEIKLVYKPKGVQFLKPCGHYQAIRIQNPSESHVYN